MNGRQILAVFGAGGLATRAHRAFGRGGGMVARGIKWPRGQTREVTLTGDHYQVSKNFLFSDPRVDPESWRLDVHGAVARPLSTVLEEAGPAARAWCAASRHRAGHLRHEERQVDRSHRARRWRLSRVLAATRMQ